MPATFSNRYEAHAIPMLEREHGDQDVCLLRGALSTATFTARRVSRSVIAMGQELDLEIKTQRRAYLAKKTSIVIEDIQCEPRQGDVLVIDGEKWRVDPPDNSTPPAEEARGGFDWRIHVQKVL